MKPSLRTSTLLLAALAAAPAVHAQGLAIRGETDTLSRLYNPRLKTFIRASTDPLDLFVPPAYGNDDGFSGINQCEAYRETEGFSEFAVLAHIEGRPGFMGSFFRNFWGGLAGVLQLPFENTRAQILLEGDLMHDLPLFDYFRSPGDAFGQIDPFDGELTQSRSGGHITFTPLVWEDSFKVRVFENWFDNAARFYRVCGTLGTWDDVLPVPRPKIWDIVADKARNNGGWPHRTARVANNAVLTIPAQGSQTIALAGPSTILELTCTVQSVADWGALDARFTWDGSSSPSVDLPLRLLGGLVRPEFLAPAPAGPPLYSGPVSGLLFNNNGYDRITTYFPMHFDNDAQLEFVNHGTTPIQLSVEYCTASGFHPKPWGYFTTTYDRGITQTGVAFRGPALTDAHGMVRYLGLESSINNTGAIPGAVSLQHLEGDLCIRINGNRGDDHVFAASETSIGHWGWYDSPSDQPFQEDCSVHTGLLSRPLGSDLYETDRLMGSILIFDPVHFVDGIEFVLEHGVANLNNADYQFHTFMYVNPGAARELLLEVDVGDLADESASNVAFTESEPSYSLTHGFFRDTQYGTTPVTDTVRVVDTFYNLTVSDPVLTTYDAFCVGFRLDRDRPGDGGICQADILVDGYWAGLMHCFTANQHFRWKEGGELEVELPRALTRGKTQFQIEIRPRLGTEPMTLARVYVYGYTP